MQNQECFLEKTQSNMPSRFIKEIGNELVETNKTRKVVSKRNEVSNNIDFKVGNVVKHQKYGSGTIIKVDKMLLTIAFKGEGIKKIIKNYVST